MVSSIILALTLHQGSMNYATLPLVLAALGMGSSVLGLLSNFIFSGSSSLSNLIQLLLKSSKGHQA
jgi:hypothetical protein